MHESADAVVATDAPGTPESTEDPLALSLRVRPEMARKLRDAGYTTPEAVRALEDDRLRELGLDAGEIAQLRAPADPARSAPPEASAVDRWVDKVRKADRPKRRLPSSAPADKDSASMLKKWVQGDDRAMEDWIQSGDTARPGRAPAPAAPAPAEPPAAPVTVPPSAGAAPGLPANLIEREETVVRWLTDLLDRVKSDQFDPSAMLQEVQELHRTVFEEQAKRKQLEEELEHVKRGSIAVIKYVRSREAKARDQAIQAKDAEIAELRLRLLTAGGRVPGEGEIPGAEPDAEAGPVAPASPAPDAESATAGNRLKEEFRAREAQFLDRETELRRRIVQLEAEIRNLRAEAGAAQQRDELRRQSGPQLSENLAKLLADADARERELMLRENELRTRFEEIRLATEDLERKRAPLAARERELEAWERQLQTTRQSVELEARRIEQDRGEDRPAMRATAEELRKLEKVKIEITNKEAEMKAHEAYLRQKIEELEALQRQNLAADFERTPTAAEAASTKVRSGVRRLDDLLFGGIPPGSQMLIAGPSHTGKEILSRLFVAEGLKQNIPAVWIATDKTYTQIRDEMTQLFPAYPDVEQKGMVRYVDLYSRSVGVSQAESGVRLLSATDKGLLDQLNQAINNSTNEFKEKFGGYRLVFESISTLTAYLDTTALFRFLQPFTGRRKLDGAVGYYLLESGMHTESDLQTIEHMMDGSINLKIEQLKTFLSVKGISDVQSRAWIGYTFSKKAFSLGSFSLDHIR
ncbi:MAG TPA: ATPase domain-containing protein [Thermoplasmata archaeon]|nr:ATPase domain-containing protein [Thermoplasmata archaeon]